MPAYTAQAAVNAATNAAVPTPALKGAPDARLNSVREHLRRYRDLAAQGKWSEAGKELEAIEALVR